MNPEYTKIPELDTPQKLFNLSGKTGLIIGGAGKMGRQFSRVLVNAGAEVIVADLSIDQANDAAHNAGASAEGFQADVSSEADVEKLFAHVAHKFGRLDFFISNVMAKPEGYYRKFESYTRETWDRVLSGNLSGTFQCCQRCFAMMKSTGGGGSIVITSSVYGISAPDQRIYKDCTSAGNLYGGSDKLNAPASYSASKSGLVGFAKWLATYGGPNGIRVNVLTPGGVYDGQEESFHQEYIQRVPLGRMATWSDYNGAVLFLVSDASRYVTGTNIVVDGGWTAW